MALSSKIENDIRGHYDSNEETLLNGWQRFEANEEVSLKIKIGCILYSTETESNDVENQSLLSHYLSIFSFEQRERIRNVFEKIRHYVPAPHEIHFGCTLVTVFEKRGLKNELLLFRCIQPSTEDVFFVEPNGRTYENWNDFIRSNKIPNGCKYFAPSDGVYSAKSQICKFQHEKNNEYVKPLFFVTGIGIIFATVLSEAPIISTILHLAMNIYGTYNCISTMRDKYKHKEPIHLSEYLMLFAIFLTHLCSIAVRWAENTEFQNWGKIALAFTVLVVLSLNTFILFKNVDNLWSNIAAIRISDLLNLSLQALLLYDQIQNARAIFKLLSKRNYRSVRRQEVQYNKGGFQGVYDSIDSIFERIYQRFGFKRNKKKYFMNFVDGLLGLVQLVLGGGVTGLLDWVRSLLH